MLLEKYNCYIRYLCYILNLSLWPSLIHYHASDVRSKGFNLIIPKSKQIKPKQEMKQIK
jgi:hypothetical protein